MDFSVMVVDDDEFVRDVIGRQIKALGASRVASAADGRQAEEVLRREGPFDLIMLDLMMPGTDGIQFLRHLSETHAEADLILISSATRKVLETAEFLAKEHYLRVLGVLSKPVASSAISELLGRRSPRRAKRDADASISADRLSAAIDAGHIVPYFQPKLCAKTLALRSVEVLARWDDPGKGMISPARFVSAAEHFGLVDKMTFSIAEQAFAVLEQWREHGLNPDVEINLSAHSLQRTDYPDRLVEIAARYGISCDRVTLEITESALMSHLSKSLDTLTRLRLKDFHLAIDDFGTGFSTFTQLKLLPLSELKVDQSFVARAVADPEARAIVESCIGLAQQFGLASVAEGVEDEQTADLVRNLGVTLLQGFWISKALPPDKLHEWWLVHLGRPLRDLE